MSRSPPGTRFSRQEYGSGLPFPTPRDLPNPGIGNLRLLGHLHWEADLFFSFFFNNCATWETQLLPGKKINNPTKKWAKDLTRHFTKDDNTNVNKHIRRCSISLAIREVQVKTTTWYQVTSTKMVKMKMRGSNKCRGGCRDIRAFVRSCGNMRWCSHFGKQSQKVKHGVTSPPTQQ